MPLISPAWSPWGKRTPWEGRSLHLGLGTLTPAWFLDPARQRACFPPLASVGTKEDAGRGSRETKKGYQAKSTPRLCYQWSLSIPRPSASSKVPLTV